MISVTHIALFFFFFFQAEDGIRDLTVTGVQTCALPIYFRIKKIGAGRVAAWPRKAGDQTQLDRVFADAEDDRDRCGRSFGRLGNRGGARRGNNGHAAADEVGHEQRHAIVLAVQPVVLHCHVLALEVAGFVEAFTERSGLARGVPSRPAVDEADDRHRRLLRLRPERPRHRRAAEQRDEVASLHSITSSASASSLSGTVTLSILAVSALMTSSNLLDCTTGKSAGLAPLRMRPA